MRVTAQVRWTKLNTNKIVAAVEEAEAAALAQGKAAIRSLLVRNLGTQYFSLRQLAALGHPYSHFGSGRPGGLPAGVVNRQSGQFFEATYVRGPFNTGKMISISVGVSGEQQLKANWLTGGTERMRGRPWAAHLRSEINRTVVPFLRNELQQRIRLGVRSYA